MTQDLPPQQIEAIRHIARTRATASMVLGIVGALLLLIVGAVLPIVGLAFLPLLVASLPCAIIAVVLGERSRWVVRTWSLARYEHRSGETTTGITLGCVVVGVWCLAIVAALVGMGLELVE